jgi:hypothetical protein
VSCRAASRTSWTFTFAMIRSDVRGE